MKMMIAVKGSEEESFFRRATELTSLAEAQVILLAHVIDLTPRSDLEHGRDRFLGRRPINPKRSEELQQVEDEHAKAVLQFARQALVSLGVPEIHIQEITVRGNPKDELHRLAREQQMSLVIVHGQTGKIGPHSVGKTARFLIDHCPQAAILVR
jgi:nucleotide-binding universal stress UspA family protein